MSTLILLGRKVENSFGESEMSAKWFNFIHICHVFMSTLYDTALWTNCFKWSLNLIHENFAFLIWLDIATEDAPCWDAFDNFDKTNGFLQGHLLHVPGSKFDPVCYLHISSSSVNAVFWLFEVWITSDHYTANATGSMWHMHLKLLVERPRRLSLWNFKNWK